MVYIESKKREYRFPREKGKNGSLNLMGLKFGRLTVVGRAPDRINEKTGKHNSRWYCNCECGTENKIIDGKSLTSGRTRSCGCLHKEVSSETAKTKISHGKKYNKYDLSGDFGIGYTSSGDEFYFDIEDFEKIKSYCWHIDDRGYVVAAACNGTNTHIRQHRLINEPNDWQVVDHINGCKYDNRKNNLRNVRQTDNLKNRGILSNNTSGHTGVYLLNNGKWSAAIGFNGEQKWLGVFNTYEEAVNARVNAEKEYFGDFRRIRENEENN